MRTLAVTLLLASNACSTPGGATPAPAAATTDTQFATPAGSSGRTGSDAPPDGAPPTVPGLLPWSPGFTPPAALDTERVHLEPLEPRHAPLDFAALMGSREHLQRTLHWGDWPRADFTLAENERDLARHWQEFVDREGYAYTVLSPDRARCLGCVYLEPLPGGDPRSAGLAYWVVEDELATALDAHLLQALLDWCGTRWPFDEVLLPTHPDNRRGAELARDLGLALTEPVAPQAVGAPPATRLFVWRRSD